MFFFLLVIYINNKVHSFRNTILHSSLWSSTHIATRMVQNKNRKHIIKFKHFFRKTCPFFFHNKPLEIYRREGPARAHSERFVHAQSLVHPTCAYVRHAPLFINQPLSPSLLFSRHATIIAVFFSLFCVIGYRRGD